MKKTLVIILSVIAICCPAALTFPDLSTPHTNTVSSQGRITISNTPAVYISSVSWATNSLGCVTNIVLTLGTNLVQDQPYFAYNHTNLSYGDSAVSAWQSSSNNFQFIAAQISAVWTAPIWTNPVAAPSFVLTTNFTPANSSNLPPSGLGSVWADTNYLYWAAYTNRIFRVAWVTNGF